MELQFAGFDIRQCPQWREHVVIEKYLLCSFISGLKFLQSARLLLAASTVPVQADILALDRNLVPPTDN